MSDETKECKNCKYHDTEPRYDRSHFEVCTRPESWMFDGFSSCDSMRTWPSMCGEGAKFYSPKKFKSRAYRASKMVEFVNMLIAYLDDRDWRRVEDIFPDEYEREVAKKLADGDGELTHCAMCRWWKWNKDAPGGCSLNVVGKCDKYESKIKREDWE